MIQTVWVRREEWVRKALAGRVRLGEKADRRVTVGDRRHGERRQRQALAWVVNSSELGHMLAERRSGTDRRGGA